MFSLVLLGARFSVAIGTLLLTSIVNPASTPVTAVNGAPISVAGFTSDGVASRRIKIPVVFPFYAYGTASGGNVKVSGGAKYAAICAPNPLSKLSPSSGSGVPLSLSIQMGPNPSNASYDVTLEKSCNGGTGGVMLANNVQLSSGATLTLSGSRLPPMINGADFIKAATLTQPNSATRLGILGILMDAIGE